MSPFRAARSRRRVAARRSSFDAPGADARLSAVRSAERWARLRTVAARVLRMFFFADAIFGTLDLRWGSGAGTYGRRRETAVIGPHKAERSAHRGPTARTRKRMGPRSRCQGATLL